jgi:hypothetical protein
MEYFQKTAWDFLGRIGRYNVQKMGTFVQGVFAEYFFACP